MRVLAGLVAVALFAVEPAPGRADEPTKRDLLEAVEAKLKAVHDAAGASVVCVVVSRSDKYPKPAKPPAYPGQLGGFDAAAFRAGGPATVALARRLDLADPRAIPDHGCAGGVVIDAAGLVLVNAHTVDGATKVYVHLPGGAGSYADVHASDARSDFAVLKLHTPPPGLKPVRFGTLRVTAGAEGRPTVVPGRLVALMADSFASGFEAARPSLSLGSVTTIRRPAATPPGPERARSLYNYSPLVEIEARSGGGASGTAVFDLDGRLIGLTSAVAAVAGEGTLLHALPFEANLRKIVDTLRRGEEVEYGYLGVIVRGENAPGILVEVAPRSPAAQAGVMSGDRITRIGGFAVDDYSDLLHHAGSAQAGTKIQLEVERGRRAVRLDLTLAKYRSDAPFIAAVRPGPVFGLRVDYTSTLAMGQNRDVPPGVAVRELVPGSPAATKFHALGENGVWVVTRVDGAPVTTPAEFYKAAKARESVRLTVVDAGDAGGRDRDVTLP